MREAEKLLKEESVFCQSSCQIKGQIRLACFLLHYWRLSSTAAAPVSVVFTSSVYLTWYSPWQFLRSGARPVRWWKQLLDGSGNDIDESETWENSTSDYSAFIWPLRILPPLVLQVLFWLVCSQCLSGGDSTSRNLFYLMLFPISTGPNAMPLGRHVSNYRYATLSLCPFKQTGLFFLTISRRYIYFSKPNVG